MKRMYLTQAETNPVTYRMLHEDAAGQGLCAEFFAVSDINPDAVVRCNCNWSGRHESTCDIVAANRILSGKEQTYRHTEGK